VFEFRKDIFTTRVARRLILTLAIVAVVPVLILAVLSLRAVGDQLRGQSEARMGQVAKAAGMALAERLQLLDAKLRIVAQGSQDASSPASAMDGFSAVLRGDQEPTPTLSSADSAHLAGGSSLLRRDDDGLLLGVLENDETLWGRLDPPFLWSTSEVYADLGTLAFFCVLDAASRPLHCDSPLGETMADSFSGMEEGLTRASFEWEARDREYLGAYWQLFLEPGFRADSWTVLVGEDRDVALQAMDTFRLNLPLALVVGLAIVLLLANVQVRRTTEPLEELQKGTQRVADRRFDTRVEIHSSDEFEELGQAFNEMSDRLGLQFRQLEAAREIDRAVLSSLEPTQIIQSLLSHFGQVVPCEELGVLILDESQEATLHRANSPEAPRKVDLDPATRNLLVRHGRDVVTRPTHDLSRSLHLSGPGPDGRHSLILPMTVQQELRGAMVAQRDEPFQEKEMERARQIADQAGVALSGAWLVSDLKEMSWGTLRALAGAIDAKSPWTGGHSARVARLAVALGRRLGLSDHDMDILERGSLLHDVGKIGIPEEILNKAGKLDEATMDIMRQHVTIGVRILEPIEAFRPMLPLVLRHHERWNGTGYPDGLTGPETHPLARILAVADAYDALISPRPYRGPLPVDTVMDYMEREAGEAFDPDVVAALVGVIHDGEEDFAPRASAVTADAALQVDAGEEREASVAGAEDAST